MAHRGNKPTPNIPLFMTIFTVPTTSHKMTSKNQAFINKAINVHGTNRYSYANTNYIKSRIKVEVICPKHGSFFVTPNNHLSGRSCQKCYLEKKASVGVTAITEYLEDMGVLFETEKTYSALRGVNGGALRYDFFVPCLNLLIEFDGQHHSIPTYFGSTKGKTKQEVYNLKQEQFTFVNANDKLKNLFAVDNGVGLVRIGYKEQLKIKEILDLELWN